MFLLLAGAAQAQLDPPAGPIVKTGKTLIEVEPRYAVNAANTPGDADSEFKITEPGSYYLTGNITGLVGKHGIEVAASGVTLDLNGFVIRGLGTIQGSFDGIFVPDGVDRVTIRNGHIELMGRHGINLSIASGCTVEGITIDLCQVSGIAGGVDGRIKDCTASNNQGVGTEAGIRVGGGAKITGCTVESNSGQGISCASGSITDCVARENDGTGISVTSRGTISGCSSFNNGGSGIVSGGESAVIGCTSNANDFYGISVKEGSVSDCVATNNTLSGIRVFNFSSVRGCTFTFNQEYGIHVSGDKNRIESNHCSENDIGIYVGIDGKRNTIDGNNCASNNANFDIDGSDNLIIRNIATDGLPNYSIVAGNSAAPRVGVVGSDGWAGIPDADHPHANFGY